MLRFGDVDLDGFPDLIFNVEYTENENQLSKSVVLRNLSCHKELLEKMKAKLEAFDSSKCREFT